VINGGVLDEFLLNFCFSGRRIISLMGRIEPYQDKIFGGQPIIHAEEAFQRPFRAILTGFF
jgi:hypothetical protein